MRFPGKSAPAATASAGSSKHENGSKFSFGVLGALLVCAAAFLGIGVSAASAAPEAQPGWTFKSNFGEIYAEAAPAHNPLAVDGAGNIFGPYQISGGLRAYGPDGSFLNEYTFPSLVRNIAIDPSDGTLYVDEFFGGTTINRYVSDGAPIPSYTVDPAFNGQQGEGMAVDPSTHDLLVADPGAEEIRRYDTSGALVATMAIPSLAPAWIAVASDGSFFVASDVGPDVVHLSSAGSVLGTISDVGQLAGLVFEPEDQLLVASVGGQLKTYSTAGQFLSAVSSSGATGLAGGPGLIYGVAGTSINSYIGAIVPGVEAPAVSNLQAESVDVSAKVDPGAGPPEGSVAHFEYSNDGGLNWVSTPDESIERTGTDEPDTIEAHLTGLSLNSEYLIRVKASNSVVAEVLSPATSFRTPEIAPLVETGSVGDRSETSAMLYGTVNPAGLQTTYHFEYGPTTSYGSRVPLEAEAPAGNRRVPRTVQKLILGLQPGTTYHYRLVAENTAGETAGDDRTFTTLEPADAFPQRVYEQVTPVDKRGAVLASDFHVQAADDGSAIAVTAVGAAADADSSLILQNYLSRRGQSGWLDWTTIDPPQDATPGLNESATAAISEDSKHALVISNRALAPGGIPGGGNLYVKDLLTGGYTFVGGAPGENAWKALTGIQVNETIFLAGAPDFSWVLFTVEPPLLPSANARAIYRWTRSTGDLKIESVLPDDSIPPYAAQAPTSGQLTFPATSSDGSVVGFGMAPFESPGGVYRRANGVTTGVSVSHRADDPTDVQPAYFDGITPDGRYVFFHGPVQLTEDAPPLGAESWRAYRYDAATDSLIYLGPTVASSPSAIVGFSDDGQTVYMDDSGGTSVWRNGGMHQVTSDRPANNAPQQNVSSDGRFFSWASPQGTIRLYDAITDQTVCVSCPPDGGSGDGARMKATNRSIGNRTTRAMLDDGTVFFDTPTRLLAADHNGTIDVYAYKDGHLDLISPGDEKFDAFFVDASEDGSSVFFQTSQGLVKQDTDGNADVYVARVGGGFASQNPAPPLGSCQGAECAEAGGQPASGPPVNTAGGPNPVAAPKKHKKHKHNKHKPKSKKHKHKGKGQKSKRHSSKTLGS